MKNNQNQQSTHLQTVSIELTPMQLRLVKDACEYLGRHLIGQPNFKPLLMEERIEKKEKTDSWYTLTDLRKVIMYFYNKDWDHFNVHSYEVLQMWVEPLAKITPKQIW